MCCSTSSMKRTKTKDILSTEECPSSEKKTNDNASSKTHMHRLISGHMYFTRVAVLPDIFNETAFSLSDILEIIRPVLSIHFNFMIETEWLMNQYPNICKKTPVTLIVGEKMGTDKNYLMREARRWENITVIGAKLPIPFGTHHTKLSLFECETKIHVIISTANLIEGDWYGKTQCFYYASGYLSDSSEKAESPFVADLIAYLERYQLPNLSYWIDRLGHSDFGGLAERIIYSVPGYHKYQNLHKMGHLSLCRCLSLLPDHPAESRKLYLAQCSSIGSLGSCPQTWLLSQFLKALQGGRTVVENSNFFLVYPCVEDVCRSIEGYSAGSSLPYQESTALRQPWLKSMMCKWRSDKKGRTRAMPHVKSYVEIVNGTPQWILLTSANLSKAAWGDLQKKNTQLMIRSYELGVLITDSSKIRLPYDYPILKYNPKDEPWIYDKSYMDPDSLGQKWIVPHK